jgi:hypothetical protein
MTKLARLGLLLALFSALPPPHLPAAGPTPDFTGHYELADAKADRSFSLDVQQTGSQAEISFSAAMADGSGAAPDGDGKGQINPAGGLTFTFKDSFENEGSGTLEITKTGFLLKLNATKVAEPRPLRFYGDVLLTRTSKKPQSS